MSNSIQTSLARRANLKQKSYRLNKKAIVSAASELTRSAAKTGFTKHRLAIVKGSGPCLGGLRRSARPAGLIDAAAARRVRHMRLNI